MLRRVSWQLVTDVSGLPIGPNSHIEGSTSSALGDGTDTFPKNFGKQGRVTSQTGKDLNYSAAEAGYLSQLLRRFRSVAFQTQEGGLPC